MVKGAVRNDTIIVNFLFGQVSKQKSLPYISIH